MNKDKKEFLEDTQGLKPNALNNGQEEEKKKKKKKKKKNKKKNNEANVEQTSQPNNISSNSVQNLPKTESKTVPNNQKQQKAEESKVANTKEEVRNEVKPLKTDVKLIKPEISENLEASQKTEPIPVKLPSMDQPASNAAEAIEEDDSEDEGIEDYKDDGYHAMHVGEVLIERYVVIQKLGWGHFSTVWLCKDFKYDSYVAIKIQKSAPHYLEAAYDEVEILQRVARNADSPEWLKSLKEYYKDEGRTRFTKDDCHCVQLLNCFIHHGPYGNHFCMVFEIMGVNLLEVIKRYNYKGIPLHLTRRMAKQILLGLDYLHRICGIIHTDLKPENILICLTKQQTKEITEKGQLSRSKEYQKRIEEYQKLHGIYVEEKKEEKPESGVQLPNKGKYYKKKLYRKKKKMKEKQALLEAQQQQQNGEIEEEIPNGDTKEPDELQEEPIQQTEQEKHMKGPKLDEDFRLKIVDLGNACWIHHHFTSKIQTRQYRSPEVILGLHYTPSADVWSCACTLFEMFSGDFLFEPRKGPNFKKNDDHYAQICELLKIFPKKYVMAGKNFKKFFDRNGNLRRIQGFHYWGLKDVLTDKYQMREDEAEGLASFFKPMLDIYPLKRSSAQQALRSKWLNRPKNMDYKMNPEEYKEFTALKQMKKEEEGVEIECETYIDSDDHDGDDEFDYPSNENSSDEDYGLHDNYGYQHLLNKSYDTGYYTGYNGGIKVNELDQGPNWQFKNRLNQTNA